MVAAQITAARKIRQPRPRSASRCIDERSFVEMPAKEERRGEQHDREQVSHRRGDLRGQPRIGPSSHCRPSRSAVPLRRTVAPFRGDQGKTENPAEYALHTREVADAIPAAREVELLLGLVETFVEVADRSPQLGQRVDDRF
jgi:hypothetical protein